MPYDVEIDYCPAYEMIVSLYAYINKPIHRHIDLQPLWVKHVKNDLTPSFANTLADQRYEVLHRVNLLVYQAPEDARTPESFLKWLGRLSPGELYDYLVPWVQHFSEDMQEVQENVLRVLTEWFDQYFKHIDRQIITRLRAAAEHNQQLLSSLSPKDTVEKLTNGICIEESSNVKKVLLVPQYHCSPFTIVDVKHGITLCQYPVFELEQESTRSLLRALQGLADENRLAMMRHFANAQQKVSFSEVVRMSGLSKSSTHYHLTTLRVAGLIRAHYAGQRIEGYTLRRNAIQQLPQHLFHYLQEK